MSQEWLVSISTVISNYSNNFHMAVEHPALRVSYKVRVISVCDRLRDVWPDPLQQVVLGRGVLVPHHQVVPLSLLPVSPGVHDVDMVTCPELVSVRLEAWCRGALTLATEKEGCYGLSFLVISCCLQVQVCVASPLHHPGVDAHTLQHLVQHL